jgi:hypothetical protein
MPAEHEAGNTCIANSRRGACGRPSSGTITLIRYPDSGHGRRTAGRPPARWAGCRQRPLNCNNKSSPLCAPDAFRLGGLWGWIELDGSSPSATSGTYDATLTFCSHQPGQTGAFHQNVSDAPWMTTTGVPAGDTAVGNDPGGMYLIREGTGLAFPVTPGHYSMSFGPGITAQSTVVLMH